MITIIRPDPRLAQAADLHQRAHQMEQNTRKLFDALMAGCPVQLPLDGRAEDAEYEEFCAYESAAGYASGWYYAVEAVYWAEQLLTA